MSENLVILDIIDLAFDGKSVAHLDGKVCFLKGGLPGEKVEARITQTKARYNQGIVVNIIEKSKERIQAPCFHFGVCGGCTWQDLEYEAQLRYKEKQVNDCLERIGKLENTKINTIVPSQDIFGYRNKMEYSFHQTEDGQFTAGLHHRGAFDKIFDLNKCLLQDEPSGALLIWMREYIRQENIEVYDVFNHTGYMRFLMIKSSKDTGEVLMNIVTNYGDFPDPEKLVQSVTTKFPKVTTIVHNQNGQKSNIAVGETEKILHGSGFITEKLLDKSFQISANSFFQTNPKQTETLYQTGFDMLSLSKDDNVLDLYCGTGSIGIIISERVNKVLGVEIVEDAIIAAKENAKINNIDNVDFFHANVKDFLNSPQMNLDDYNILIIDPPRAGINPKALKKMLKLTPEKILYISCNPATFARDAEKIVESGYSLPEVTPVDMFPHTMHIELVSVFYRG